MTGSKRLAVAVAAFGISALFACERAGRASETTTTKVASADTVPERPPIVPERCATMPASWTEAVTPARLKPRADSARTSATSADSAATRDSTSVAGGDTNAVRADSGKPASRTASRGSRARGDTATRRAARDSFPTPPTPLPGSVLPGCRIVAYYGNPLSKRMGVMGQYPPAQMLAMLDSQAKAFERADTTKPVIRALELITPVAQGSPGAKGLWRMRMPDTLIENVAKLAESKGYLLILDVQVGKSNVADELAPLLPWLKRPYVHLALDPEFSMKGAEPPGKKIGTMDAADVNVAIHVLEKLVDENKLPPKLLIVHRFTQRMLTNHEKIERDPRVQVIINMDGFGPPSLKLGSYQAYVHDRPVQYFGIKLFYKNDKPIFTPADVMRLNPIPQYIQFQ